MCDEAQLTEKEVIDYYQKEKDTVTKVAKLLVKCVETATKRPYTRLKEWFLTNSKLNITCNGLIVLSKYITAFSALMKSKDIEWSPPEVFGLNIPKVVNNLFDDCEEINAISGDEEPAAEAEQEMPSKMPKACHSQPKVSKRPAMTSAMPEAEDDDSDEDTPMSAQLLAKMEERITRKIMANVNCGSSTSHSGKKASMSELMRQIHLDDGDQHIMEREDGQPGTSFNTKCIPSSGGGEMYDVSPPEIDDEDVLYFPMHWIEMAVNVEDRRVLLKTLKDACAISNPKHKDKAYQIDHLLRVLKFILADHRANACEAIADRILFLLKASKKPVGEAVEYYESLLQRKRPMRYKEAEIKSSIPKSVSHRQASFLSNAMKGQNQDDRRGQGKEQDKGGDPKPKPKGKH